MIPLTMLAVPLLLIISVVAYDAGPKESLWSAVAVFGIGGLALAVVSFSALLSRSFGAAFAEAMEFGFICVALHPLPLSIWCILGHFRSQLSYSTCEAAV